MRFTRMLLLTCVVGLVVAPAAMAIRFTDQALSPPFGEVGKAYSFTLTGAGGCGPALPYQYKVLNGAPPPGLTLHSSGLIDGTPTQAGSYSFWVDLSDQNPPSAAWCRPADTQRQLTITIVQGLQIVQRESTLTAAFVNEPYSFQLTAVGGGTQTWSVKTGALPAGITIDPATGLISGTPTTEGDYNFQIQVTDGTRFDIQTYTMAVVQKLAIAKSGGAPVGEVGRPFSLSFSASGGRGTRTWTLAQGQTAPAGLALDSANGTITGVPTAAGTYPLTLVVTDGLGLAAQIQLNVTVAGKLALAKERLTSARVGHSFSAHLLATGGVRPRAWGARSLPAGLKLDTHTGVISGTPTKAGTYRVRVNVTDRLGAHAAAVVILRVH